MSRFNNLGVIKNTPEFSEAQLNLFVETISELKDSQSWTKEQLVQLFFHMIPDFAHKETGKYLDSKM